MFVFFVYSGNPAPGCWFQLELQLGALAVGLGLWLVSGTNVPFSSAFAVIGAIYFAVFLIQCIGFAYYPMFTMAGFFVRVFVGYAFLRLVNPFPLVYVQVMVGLALLSFAFYVPSVILWALGVDLLGIISALSTALRTTIESSTGYGVSYHPLLLHTFVGTRDFPRNAGMFWEPGAFQGYLVLGLIFLAFIKRSLSRNQYLRWLTILSVTVLSTLSTTGYIALFVVFLLHYGWRAEKARQTFFTPFVTMMLILPLLGITAAYAFRTIPFLGQKIELQMEALRERNEGWHRGRIGSFVFDLDYIKTRPLTGWGLHSETRYSLHPGMTNSEGMGNGFSDFTAKMGVIGMATWFVAVYIGFYRLSGGQWQVSAVICAILLLELQGECFLGHPLFLGLAFIGCATALPIARKAEASTRLPCRHRHPTDKTASVHHDDDNGYQSNRCPDHMP